MVYIYHISHPKILDSAKCWPLCDFLPIIFILIANPLGTTKEPAFSLRKQFLEGLPDQLIRPPLLDIYYPVVTDIPFSCFMHTCISDDWITEKRRTQKERNI